MSQVPVQVVAGNPLPGRRLLVIDNELSILQSMAALLGQWGCDVLTATDEAGAFDVLQGRAPELILADFNLDHGVVGRSEERRVGKEGVRTGRSRWAPYDEKKTRKKI